MSGARILLSVGGARPLSHNEKKKTIDDLKVQRLLPLVYFFTKSVGFLKSISNFMVEIDFCSKKLSIIIDQLIFFNLCSLFTDIF